MTAFSLPGSLNAKFNPVSTGDLHIVADGKGEFSQGTWEHKISSPNLNIVCKLKLASGSYAVHPDGTGSDDVKWELIKAESPRACFRFFSPVKAPITSVPQIITMDKSGSVFYSTSLNPFSVLNVVCQRDETSQMRAQQ